MFAVKRLATKVRVIRPLVKTFSCLALSSDLVVPRKAGKNFCPINANHKQTAVNKSKLNVSYYKLYLVLCHVTCLP